MVYYTDGRQPPVYNTPAGPMSPLAYTPGVGQNPTQLSPGEQIGGSIGGAIGGILGGMPGQLIGGIGGALIGGALDGGLWGNPDNPWSGVPGISGAGAGDRLVVFRDGVLVAGIYGPGKPFSWGIQNPALHDAPGTAYHNKPIVDGNGRTRKRAIFTPQGEATRKGGLYGPEFQFVLLNDLGIPIGGDGVPGNGGYRPGRSLDPNNPDNDGSPDNPFDSPDFLPGLRDALGDLLGDLLSGGGGTPGGPGGDPGGGPGGEEGEEGEEDEGDDDESCSGKHPLRILKTTVDKVYFLLGGDLFGGDKCNSGDTEFDFAAEDLVRQMAERQYKFEVSDQRAKITPEIGKVKNLVELICSLSAIGYVRSGHWKFPNAAPESLTKDPPGILGGVFDGLIPQQQRVFYDAMDVQAWHVEQLDALMGQWGQEIIIADADLEEPGDQEKRMFLPNLAEAVAEMFYLNYETKLHTDTVLNTVIRLAYEVLAIKKEVFATEFNTDAILTYLGPKTKEVKKKMPSLFRLHTQVGENPTEEEVKNKGNLPRFLESGEKDIVVTELADKVTLSHDLQRLREIEAIVKAVHTGKLNRNGGNEEILRRAFRVAGALVDGADYTEAIRAGLGNDIPPQSTEPNRREKDFDTWLDEVEDGFVGEAGVTDDTPYGRPKNQRPRIRRVGERPTPEQEDN